MSDQNTGGLTDQEKIDRAAWHEEVRWLKNQQWAVTTAGVVLFGAFLTTLRNVQHMTALEKFLAVVLIALGVWAGWFYLDSLQNGLAGVRRALDRDDPNPAERGDDILGLHKAILIASAVVVVWVVLFKVG
jgi:hypothetical protein